MDVVISTLDLSSAEMELINEAAAEGLNLPIDFALTRNGRYLAVLESGAVRLFGVDRSSGELIDLDSNSRGVPVFDEDGFAAQGLVIR